MDQDQQIEAYPYVDELNDIAHEITKRTERMLEIMKLELGFLNYATATEFDRLLAELNPLTQSIRESYHATALVTS